MYLFTDFIVRFEQNVSMSIIMRCQSCVLERQVILMNLNVKKTHVVVLQNFRVKMSKTVEFLMRQNKLLGHWNDTYQTVSTSFLSSLYF